MENTLENKARFFAQYWGQKVRRPAKGLPLATAHSDIFCWLELKSLSDITDEDSINTVDSGHTIEFLEKGWRLKESLVIFDYKSHMVDYLRSKGYALPFTSLSVAQQIEYGWVKLILKQ